MGKRKGSHLEKGGLIYINGQLIVFASVMVTLTVFLMVCVLSVWCGWGGGDVWAMLA